LRIVPATQRLMILKNLINLLKQQNDLLWRDVLAALVANCNEANDVQISKNIINAVMLLARQADIIKTLKGKSLSTAPVLLSTNGDHTFQDAIIRSDSTYLQAILNLSEPFDLKEAALALYDKESFVPYLRRIMQSLSTREAD